MDHLIDLEELRSAWRALQHQASGAGWRTIPILVGRACPILAGREFPGNEESILVGFSGIRRPTPESLPGGQGFIVTSPELGAAGRDRTWIGLARQPGGDLGLFSTMAADVLGTLETQFAIDDIRRFSVFIDRIRSWQEFMRRGTPQLLSPEAELGLVGELQVLDTILQSGYPAGLTVAAWTGPRRGLHDFKFSNGVIEAKTAIANAGFPAEIASLDQLDDSIVSPIFLAAVRLTQTPTGTTLPQRVDAVRGRLMADHMARTDFDSRLIVAGYMDSMSASYMRPFHLSSQSYFKVDDTFPRMTASSVPRGVMRARYEINLALVTQPPQTSDDILKQLGIVV